MKELRTDGTIEGEHKLARICVMLDDEVNEYWNSLITGEREDDIAKVETYEWFIRWVSEYMPIEKGNEALAALNNANDVSRNQTKDLTP